MLALFRKGVLGLLKMQFGEKRREVWAFGRSKIVEYLKIGDAGVKSHIFLKSLFS